MPKLLPFRKNITNSSGFTLVELLVVISIIALLSVVGLVVFTNVQKNARDARRNADVEAISTALEAHYGDTGCGATANSYCAVETTWFAGGGGIPQDPQGGVYQGVDAVVDGATTYKICTDLEADGKEATAAAEDFCRTQQR